MDPRVVTTRAIRVAPSDMYEVRNAGGRVTDDVVRSALFASGTRGVREFVVLHHEDCGLFRHSEPEVRHLVGSRLHVDTTAIDFATFSNHDEAVIADVQAIRDAHCVPPGGAVSGLMVDEVSGRVRVVTGDPASQLAWVRSGGGRS
jgi:carbonic anhydrase